MHPTRLGAALTHPYLTTDYAEALLEFVTPAYPTNWETIQFLCDSHSFVCQNLDGELLWAQSMPCIVDPNQNLSVAAYGPSNIGQMKTIYRRGLGYLAALLPYSPSHGNLVGAKKQSTQVQ